MRLGGAGVAGFATVVLAGLGAGCAGTKTVTEHALEPAAGSTPTTQAAPSSPKPRALPAKVALNNPAQHADPSTHVACDQAAMGHACVASTSTPSDPNESPQRNCDTNIVANAGTSCALAENTFYEYYEASRNGNVQSFGVHSPSTGRDYELGCQTAGGLVGCVGSPTSTGIYVSFPAAAVVAYTPAQAHAYAASRDIGHPKAAAKPRSSPAPAPESPPAREPPPAPESEPSGETDEVGSSSHATDAEFCSEHECIGSFTTEEGTIVECSDETYSHAGGISGACSHHGGER